jgi:C4-dicarboxylate transporter, DctQ subunit
MHRLSYIINRLANAATAAAVRGIALTGILMSIVIFLQIFFRFVIYLPFPWSEEIARYLMVWMGFLGASVALRHGRHIGVTILVDKLPGRMRTPIRGVVQVAMIGFLVVVAKEGFALAVFNASQRSPALEIPMFFPYLAIPTGALLMILDIAAGLIHQFYPTSAGTGRMNSAELLT